MVAKCLYDILEVSKEADDSEIKKAYRKQALIWHPDKNAYRAEEAAERFKEIQNAYEVLSDKHERAWYDSHRDQILRSGERHQAGNTGTGMEGGGGIRPQDMEEIFQYFTTSCFSGFGDGPRGFFGVYATLFEKLSKAEKEDRERKENEEGVVDSDSEAAYNLPSFGTSTSEAAEVYAFYARWGTFSSMRSFAWADLYNPAAAPNRQVRRKMEQENEKSRRKEKKEYNDNVRELIAFVKKRDPRVAKFAAEEAVRRAEREKEEEEKRKREKAERAARAAAYEEADWIKASEAEAAALLADQESEEESESEEHYCVACDKTFKSAKQLHNHERSKKHVEMVAALRAVLQEEEGIDADEVLGAAPGPNQGGAAGQHGPGSAKPGSDARGRKGKKKKKGKGKSFQDLPDLDDDDEDLDTQEPPSVQRPGQNVPKSTSQQDEDKNGEEGGDVFVDSADDGDDDEDGDHSTHVHRHKQSGFDALLGSGTDDDVDDDDNALREGQDTGEDTNAASGEDDQHDEDEDEDAMLARLMAGSAKLNSKTGNSKPTKQSHSKQSQSEQAPQSSGKASSGTTKQQSSQPIMAASLDSDDDWGKGGSGKGGKGKGKKGGSGGNARAAPTASSSMSSLAGGAGGGSSITHLPPGKGSGSGKAAGRQPAGAQAVDQSSDDEDGTAGSTKKDKRKAKAAARKAAASAPSDDPLTCKVCATAFPSRSKLFSHIKETGHAALRS